METTPYWFSTPLPAFPSISRDVDVDVAVIGGGLTGITAAWLVKEAGAKVALLERERCASGDTGHTTAHLTYVTDLRLHQVVKNFGRDGAKAFWDAGAAAIDQIYGLVQAHAIDCEFQWIPGYLHAAWGSDASKESASLHDDCKAANELGFEAEFVDQAPYAGQPGIRFLHQAKFHPRKYLAALLERVPGNGSDVFEQSAVSAIEDGSPLTLHVGSHRVRCRFVVIATHCPIMGKTSLVKATLFQSKLALYTSYVLGARLERESLPEALFWDTCDPYHYLRVDRRDDHDYIIFGGEDCKTGQERDPGKVFARLEQRLKECLPRAEVRDRWLGQVVETNDGLPFIGENASGQFVATGFCGNGFTLGTLSAMMARDHFLGKRNPWSDLFEIHRKKIRGGAWRYVTENLDYPFHLLRDRLAGAEVDSTDGIQIGEGKIARIDGKKVAAYRDETGKVNLLSPVCTHLGCIVRWNAADRTWDCPCHGSRFHPTGEVFAGPAETPLERLPLSGG